MAENLPYPQNTREKYGTTEGEERGKRMVLSWIDPDSFVAKLIRGEG